MTPGFRALPLLLFLLSSLSPCCSSPPRQKRMQMYSHALRFTRRIRTRVQNLLLQYKEHQLGDKNYEDRDLVLQTLPSISTQYTDWLKMQDWERLSLAKKDLYTFWAHLDAKRWQQEEERKSQGKELPLDQSMWRIQTDLQDLIKQLNSLNGAAPEFRACIPTTTEQIHSSALVTWHDRLRVYVVLRDLERYLAKLARDFTLLRFKHRA